MIIVSNTNLTPAPNFQCGYEDNFFTFQSTSLIVPLNASITIDNVPIILYPNPQGKFYFNFKEYITYALNRIELDPVKRVIYYNTPIQINFINNTAETLIYPLVFFDGKLYFKEVFGVEFLSVPKIKLYLGIADQFFLDTACESPVSSATKFYKKDNPSNFYTATNPPGTVGINIPYDANIIVSSGVYVVERNTRKSEIEIEIETCLADRFSIKFKNSSGGYSFWSFDYWQVQRQPKDLGEVSTNTNVMLQIGKSAKDIITVESDVNYQDLFNDLLESNTIYYFDENLNFEIEIALTAQSKTIKDFKNNKPFTLQFELPARYTRTL